MPEIDKVKEKLEILKKKYDQYFKLFLLFLTATGITTYNVLIGDKPVYILMVSIALAITTVLVLKEMKKVNAKIDDEIDKLGDL